MDPRERARKLAALATDPAAPRGERSNAALALARLVVDHDLLSAVQVRAVNLEFTVSYGDAPTRPPRRRKPPA